MAQIVEPLLTIAVPTFNRPEQIQNQIRLILPQLNEKVCLVVYDNYSDIPIETYFSEEELSQFILIRNKMNVGADANIARCFENCNTKWLWTLSDDDFVKRDAIEIVLKETNVDDDVVFINFCEQLSFVTTGFDELAKVFKSATVFSSSFTMSSCLYDMSKLRNSLQNYYSTLSSMMGTIILVLKYVQANSNAVCKFVHFTPIDKYNDIVGWNYSTFIRRTRLFIESFDPVHDMNYNRTLFLGCHLTNYSLIGLDRKESKVSYKDRWRLLHLTLKNQGFVNATLYSPRSVLRVFKGLVLQHRYLKMIKKIRSERDAE